MQLNKNIIKNKSKRIIAEIVGKRNGKITLALDLDQIYLECNPWRKVAFR